VLGFGVVISAVPGPLGCSNWLAGAAVRFESGCSMVTGVGVARGCCLGRLEGVFAWVFAGLGESKWMREPSGFMRALLLVRVASSAGWWWLNCSAQ